MYKKYLIPYAIIALNFFMVSPVFSTGLDNSGIGTSGLSMGGAFTGTSDDASAVYYNPGGLGFGQNNTWNAQVYSVFNLTNFSYSTSLAEDKSDEFVVNPGLFISKKYEKWAIGYGFYIPYAGGGTKFNKFQESGYTIEGYEAYVAHTPTVAYQFSDKLAAGVGISVFQGVLESKLFQYTFVESEYDGVAGYGFDIGIMYKYTKSISIGFVYKSQVQVEMDGEVNVSNNLYPIPEGDSELKMTLPTYFYFGIGYALNPKTNIGFDACFMRYGDMDKRSIETGGVKIESPTNYKNGWRLSFGARYKTTEKLTILGGLKFIQSHIKNHGLDVSNDIDILIPPSCEVDILSFASGVSYAIKGNIKLNVSGFYVNGFEEEVSGKKYNQKHISLVVGADFIF